jgi:serine protease Do
MSRRLTLALALVAMGFIAGLVVTGRARTTVDARPEPLAPPPVSTGATGESQLPRSASVPSAAPSNLAGADFTRIAGQAVKGVANISSLQVVRTRNSPFANDPFFRYFFGDDDVFGARDRRSMSLGSGVIISTDGYVVTNNHVVGEDVRAVTAIKIALPDKREIKATLIGMDPMTDIALLKIGVTGLPVVPWGDSTQLKVGEWVLAIGSPFQLSQTVTAGIVSATGRANMGFAQYEDFIQTDAAINPGNSGGALINTRGELVGINTGIYSESGGYQGIGFAVPSNLARRIVDDLMKYGEVRRGSIGTLRIERLTTEYAEELGLSNINGALIVSIGRASEAFEAGMRPGDLVIGFNGHAIDDPSQFLRLVADARIGSTASVRAVRGNRTIDFNVPIVSSSRQQLRRR